MKRKFLEGIGQKKIRKKKGYVCTCAAAGEYLVIDTWKNGNFVGRYAIDLGTGEYGSFWDGKWHRNRLLRMFDLDPLYYYSGDPPITWETLGDMETCKEAALRLAPGSRGRSWYKKIHEAETEYNQMKYEAIKERKFDRARKLMQQVPPLPDLKSWIFKNTTEAFAFWDRDTGLCGCSACGGRFPRKLDGRERKHGEEITCPVCGKRITVQTRRKQVVTEMRVCVLQSMPPGVGYKRYENQRPADAPGDGIARHVKATLVQDYGGRHIYTQELVRLMLRRGGGIKIYYDQDGEYTEWWPGITRPAWWTTNCANRRIRPCILYPGEIREALAETDYEGLVNGFTALAEQGITGDYNAAMVAGKRIGGLGPTLEYLAKGRFFRLAGETMGSCDVWGGKYFGPLDLYGETQEQAFKIYDRQKINRIRQQDGGEIMVTWLQYADESNEKIPQETLDWLEKEKIRAGELQKDLPQAFTRMSATQVVNYIRKQQAHYKNAEEVIEHWADYLAMCEMTGKKLDDPLIYRPTDLKKRHDELVMDKQKLEAVKRLTENPERRREEAQAMREKFPEAERILEEVGKKYTFVGGEFLMRIPKDLVEIVEEGYALHHCGGSSDRYFNRICNRETFIGFLRRADEPQIPFYTVEFEPDGTIRQNRSYYDEEPGIEEIRGFLRQWQQEVRKRMTRRDLEDARKSAALREENLKELRENRNTFVLQKLMEDFMEAG